MRVNDEESDKKGLFQNGMTLNEYLLKMETHLQ